MTLCRHQRLILKAAIGYAVAACLWGFLPDRQPDGDRDRVTAFIHQDGRLGAMAGGVVLASSLVGSRNGWPALDRIQNAEALADPGTDMDAISSAILAGLVAVFGWIACLRMRAQLKEALNQAKAAQALPGFICSFRLAPDGTPTMPGVSPSICELCGISSKEIPGDPALFWSVVHPDDRARLDDSMADSARDLSPWRAEFRVNHPKNGLIWIEGNLMPERDADGGTTWHGFIFDATRRKRDDIGLRLAKSVFENTREGVVVTDPKGLILAVNPAFCRITGYDEAEVAGKNPRLMQSGRHDSEFYHVMWKSLAETGFWQGEIWNRRKSGEIYPELLSISTVGNGAGEVINYVGTFADITTIKESETRLVHLAHHDALTGLPNRIFLLARLNHAIQIAQRKHAMGAVLFLDLDHFKNVNDTLGHPAGDELLLAVTKRLDNRLRGIDTLARLGGDEFIVLMEEVPDANAAARLAQSLLDQFEEPYLLTGGHEVYIGASIGISLFPEESVLADEVVKHADAALYRAKKEGRGIYRFYTSALTEKANDRLDMERRLRRALQQDEFLLLYQPVISIPERRIVGVEALVRWNEDGNGLVLPAQFIPLAEETGIIIPLGERVLRMACRQMKAWTDAGYDFGSVALNLSPRQFHLADFDQIINSVLQETGLRADLLELELTEGALIDQGTRAEVRLASFGKLGIRVSIDDFGTGYSSLANLRRFPVNRLKIDRSFIRGIPDDPAAMDITAAIVALARTLKLDVVAVGVETDVQLAFLRQLGCSHAQGYYFSRPVAPTEIPALLQLEFPAQE